MKLSIISFSNKTLVERDVRNYTHATWHCIDRAELLYDDDFSQEVRDRFKFNTLQAYRNFCTDILAKLDAANVQQEEREKKLEVILEDIKSEEDAAIKYKLWKKYHKLKRKSKEKPSVTFGGKSNQRKLTKAHNKLNLLKQQNASEKEIDKQEKLVSKYEKEFKKNREEIPVFSQGEANLKGNRYFDLTNLSSCKSVYKPNKTEHSDIFFKCNKKQKKELIKIERMCRDKELAVTVRLDSEYLYLSYDNECVAGYAFDEKAYKAELKETKKKLSDVYNRELTDDENKELKRTIARNYFEKKEAKMNVGKIKNRTASLDFNPLKLSLVISDLCSDGSVKVIDAYEYDLSFYNNKWRYESSETNTHINNKHKHDICLLYQHIFKVITHYKCSVVAVEDLTIKLSEKTDKGTTTDFRRKVNSIWHYGLQTSLITKYCENLGIKEIKVNPCFSSWIGNIKYGNLYSDPVAAAMEIGRRSFYKYKSKSNNYPFPELDDKDYGKLVDLFPEFFKDESVVRKFTCQRSWSFWHKTLRTQFRNKLDFEHRYRAALESVSNEKYECRRLYVYNSRIMVTHFY